MIVLNTKETATMNNTEMDRKKTFEDMFRMEVDAYCEYKALKEDTEDTVLEMALEEIMTDEYLHAKFLRDYMMDKDMFTLTEDDPHVKKFWKIHKKVFRD
jgi:hypothetical protein